MPDSGRIEARASVDLDHSAEAVFDAFLDEETVASWMQIVNDETGAGKLVRVSIDPREGGRFDFVDDSDGEEIETIGEYLKVVRPTHLGFTWQIPAYLDDLDIVSAGIEPSVNSCDVAIAFDG